MKSRRCYKIPNVQLNHSIIDISNTFRYYANHLRFGGLRCGGFGLGVAQTWLDLNWLDLNPQNDSLGTMSASANSCRFLPAPTCFRSFSGLTSDPPSSSSFLKKRTSLGRRNRNSRASTTTRPQKSILFVGTRQYLMVKTLQTIRMAMSCNATEILSTTLQVNLYLMRKMRKQRTRGMLSKYLALLAWERFLQSATSSMLMARLRWQKNSIHLRQMFYSSRWATFAAISQTRARISRAAATPEAYWKFLSQVPADTRWIICPIETYHSGATNQKLSPRQNAQTFKNCKLLNLQANSLTTSNSAIAPPIQQINAVIKYPLVQMQSPAVQQLLRKEGIKVIQLQERLSEKVVSVVSGKTVEKMKSSCAKQRVREQWRPRRVVKREILSPAQLRIWPTRVWLEIKLMNIILWMIK